MLNRGPALLAQLRHLNAQLYQTCLYLTGRCAPPSMGGNVVPVARPLMRLKVLNPPHLSRGLMRLLETSVR